MTSIMDPVHNRRTGRSYRALQAALKAPEKHILFVARSREISVMMMKTVLPEVVQELLDMVCPQHKIEDFLHINKMKAKATIGETKVIHFIGAEDFFNKRHNVEAVVFDHTVCDQTYKVS